VAVVVTAAKSYDLGYVWKLTGHETACGEAAGKRSATAPECSGLSSGGPN
jgi:hypothetical protein